MQRRDLLKRAPAFGLAGILGGAVAVPAIAATIAPPALTPITEMHRKITRAQELLNRSDNGLTAEEADLICDRMMEMANEIVDLPCEGPMDMLRKIMGHTVNGDHELGNCPAGKRIWAEARQMMREAA